MAWKHPRDRNYEPTPAQIRRECEKIRRNWTSEEKTKRRANLPLVQHWMPPTIYSLTNEYGEFCILTRQDESWWTNANGRTVGVTSNGTVSTLDSHEYSEADKALATRIATACRLLCVSDSMIRS